MSDGQSPVRWTVLDQEGEVAYELSLPQDARVLRSREDLFAATREGDDGVPSIVVCRMHERVRHDRQGTNPASGVRASCASAMLQERSRDVRQRVERVTQHRWWHSDEFGG